MVMTYSTFVTNLAALSVTGVTKNLAYPPRSVETAELFPVVERGKIPHCVCGGIFKPDITFFGEMLPEADWNGAVDAMSRADLVLVLGTSLAVYPAAGLPDYRPFSSKLVIINRDPTPLDYKADLLIHDDLCDVLSAV